MDNIVNEINNKSEIKNKTTIGFISPMNSTNKSFKMRKIKTRKGIPKCEEK